MYEFSNTHIFYAFSPVSYDPNKRMWEMVISSKINNMFSASLFLNRVPLFGHNLVFSVLIRISCFIELFQLIKSSHTVVSYLFLISNMAHNSPVFWRNVCSVGVMAFQVTCYPPKLNVLMSPCLREIITDIRTLCAEECIENSSKTLIFFLQTNNS